MNQRSRQANADQSSQGHDGDVAEEGVVEVRHTILRVKPKRHVLESFET